MTQDSLFSNPPKLHEKTSWRARSILIAQVLVIFLLALPIAGYTIWLNVSALRQQQLQAVVQEANQIAAGQTTLIASTRSLLTTMSVAPVIRGGDPKKIYDYFVLLDLQQPEYEGFALYDLHGNTIASIYQGHPRILPPTTIQHRFYFQEALPLQRVHISTLVHTDETTSILPMTIPVRDLNDTISGLLMASISLHSQQRFLDTLFTDKEATVFILDANQTVMTQRNMVQNPKTSSNLLQELRQQGIIERHAYNYTETDKATGVVIPSAYQELFLLRKSAAGAWQIARYCTSKISPTA